MTPTTLSRTDKLIILTLDEVAARIGLLPQSLRSRIHTGKIGTLPLWKSGDGPKSRWVCYESEIEDWIDARKGKKEVDQ